MAALSSMISKHFNLDFLWEKGKQTDIDEMPRPRRKRSYSNHIGRESHDDDYRHKRRRDESPEYYNSPNRRSRSHDRRIRSRRHYDEFPRSPSFDGISGCNIGSSSNYNHHHHHHHHHQDTETSNYQGSSHHAHSNSRRHRRRRHHRRSSYSSKRVSTLLHWILGDLFAPCPPSSPISNMLDIY